MAAPLDSLSSQEYARVEDYLNDKLQSDEDLDTLDSLLQTLRTQHELQRKQVCDRHPLQYNHRDGHGNSLSTAL